MKAYEVGRGKEYRTIQEALDAMPGDCRGEGVHINATVDLWDKILWSLQKIICKIFGHKWRPLEDSELICARCNEPGFVADCDTGFNNISAGELYEEDEDGN